ncbi:pyridoxal phosphate-dependent transferase [Vararia minispora EC-137]|uniref:Pyridoxal phosphate-dependent transferase n=1 Tax=Vararia minispora EC-137 TaxID=1314806 RepID=A0ACB8QI30_9AGAM|nr:pyridoxal phosphate-dependent transferase [Vararia minispora EC-137]
MDIEDFRKAGYDAVDRICDYYLSLRDRPVVAEVEPAYLRKTLPDHAPEQGEPWADIANDYSSLIVPGLTHWQHPSFFAYFPTAATFEGMLGDFLASSTANPGFNWLASPACTELESVVMDWAAKMFGLDPIFYNEGEIGGGVIQTTASDSALTAIVAARSRYMTLHPSTSMESLVIYVTSQTHSFGKKAGLVLGLKVRALPVDETARRGDGLDATTLRAAVEEDRAAGHMPFVLVATVGTTTSGLIDCVKELGALLKEDYPDIWLHVDAAWAGCALSCPEYRERAQLEGINLYADSLCINFHKWGLINFDCSALWVRERARLIDALDITPEYLRTKHGDAGTVIEFRNWHLSLGRRFRSLKIWFVLRSYGVSGFRAYIRRCIACCDVFASHIRETSGFELVAPPSFSLTLFRILPNGPADEHYINMLNRAFFDALLARHDLLLTQTELGGTFCVRFSVGSARTTVDDIEKAWTVVKDIAKDVRLRFSIAN